MNARLLSDGRVTIPRQVRKELGLGPGTRLRVRVVEGSIVLEPLTTSVVDEVYGAFTGVDLLTALEQEHARECPNEE